MILGRIEINLLNLFNTRRKTWRRSLKELTSFHFLKSIPEGIVFSYAWDFCDYFHFSKEAKLKAANIKIFHDFEKFLCEQVICLKKGKLS